MQVLLINNRYNAATEHIAAEITAKLKAFDVTVLIDNGLKDLTGQIPDKLDLIIVLGGDGTVLRASRQYALKQTPVLGINMGTIGFLSHIEVGEFDSYLKRLISGEYFLDKRMILEVNIIRENHLVASVNCLNEVVIRAKTLHMISFAINIDEQKLETFKGDGLIIATPTGSTAYSLSAGGPVVDPDLEAFIVTPIASHKLNKPSMLVSPNKIITLTPVSCTGAIIGMDGQVSYDFDPSYKLSIRRADITLNLINFKKHLFFQNVNNKLGR